MGGIRLVNVSELSVVTRLLTTFLLLKVASRSPSPNARALPNSNALNNSNHYKLLTTTLPLEAEELLFPFESV